MEITKERGIQLLTSYNIYELSLFIREYCSFYKKDYNLTTVFIQMLIARGSLKPLVDSTVEYLLIKNNISITRLIDLKTNTIIKIF